MNHKTIEQQGVVSFLSVFFISILLTVITTGFIRVMINEQRQAADFNQSARAYAAAESGVEHLVSELAAGETKYLDNDGCEDNSDFADIFGSGADADSLAITCALVGLDDDASAQFPLEAGQTSEINLEHAADFDELRIRWHTADITEENFNPPGSAYSLTDWADLPPYLRAAFVSHPSTGAIGATDFVTEAVVLWPTSTGTDDGVFSLSNTAVNTAVNSEGLQVSMVGCQQDGPLDTHGYYCEAQIQGFDSNRTYQLNLKPFLVGNNQNVPIEVAAFNGADQVSVNTSIVAIDVTARAGDIFRRIESSFVANSNVNTTFGYDYSVFGDSGVCKNVQVERNASDGSDQQVINDTPGCN